MSNDSERNTVPSKNPGLSRYSSDLIKRGLELANKTQALNSKSLQRSQPHTIQAEVEELLECGKEKLSEADYQGAFKDFNQALKINPNHAEAYENRGTTRSKVGDTKAQ